MDLIGPCNAGSEYVTHTYQKGEAHREGVCTNAARFHHYLSRLGFTEMSTPEELSLIDHGMAIASLPEARLFLMEINQFSIENQTRANTLTQDLQNYIGLRESATTAAGSREETNSRGCQEYVHRYLRRAVRFHSFDVAQDCTRGACVDTRLFAQERPGGRVVARSFLGVARGLGPRSLCG